MARAFIKKPKVLILDEATSALDKRNETEVLHAIEKMREAIGEVTTIVIAHRLTTVRDADKICVLVAGECVEQGSHDQLMQEYPNGVYAGLINL